MLSCCMTFMCSNPAINPMLRDKTAQRGLSPHSTCSAARTVVLLAFA